MRVKRSELPRLLGVSRQQVHVDIRDGLYRPGSDGLFDLDEVQRGRLARNPFHGGRRQDPWTEPDPDNDVAAHSPAFREARARREVAEAELAELKVRKARGELMPRSDCEAICVGAFTMARAEWQVIPTRMAERLAGLSASEVKAILTAEVDSILRNTAETLRAAAAKLESEAAGRE